MYIRMYNLSWRQIYPNEMSLHMVHMYVQIINWSRLVGKFVGCDLYCSHLAVFGRWSYFVLIYIIFPNKTRFSYLTMAILIKIFILIEIKKVYAELRDQQNFLFSFIWKLCFGRFFFVYYYKKAVQMWSIFFLFLE